MEKREENTGLGVRVQGLGNAQNPKPDTQYPSLKDMPDVERIIEQVKLFCPNVAKLPKQLTAKEVESLLKQFTKNEIIHQLNQMENYRPLTKKYNSVYLTLRKWFEIDIKKGFITPKKPVWDSTRGQNIEPKTSDFYQTLTGVVENMKKESPKKYYDYSERQTLKDNFLKKFPIGSFIRSNTGNEYEVFDAEFLKDIYTRDTMPIAFVVNHHFSLIKGS